MCVLQLFSQVIGDSDLDDVSDDAEVNDGGVGEVSDDAECWSSECWSSDLLGLDGGPDVSSFKSVCRTKLLTD